jgi:hypothetical protein
VEGRVTTDGGQAILAVRVLGSEDQLDGESGLGVDAVGGFKTARYTPPETYR